MAAILVFGAVAAGLIAAPQTAYAAVSITASADTFYGPGFVRVLIIDDAFDEAGDVITPTIEARKGSSVLGSVSPQIESVGSSGNFEFFITTSDSPLVPENPTKTTDDGGVTGADAGPYIIRVNTGETGTLSVMAAGTGVNVNGGGDSTFAANNYGIGVDMDALDGDNFRVVYGGQTLVINFEDTTAQITADRTEAGEDNEIVLQINDQDANLDPTLIDEFEDSALTPDLDSTNAVTLGDATWRETGQNTGLFELVVPISVNGATNFVTATLPAGNTFTHTDHSVHEVLANAVAPYNAVTSEDDTDSVSVTLRNRDGAVELLEDPTIANGLQAQITDADRNIDTGDGDDIAAGEVEVFVDLDGDGEDDDPLSDAIEPNDTFDFTETGDSTGIFLPDYSDDKITIKLGAATAVDGDAGTITLTADNVADDVEIVMVYTDPAFQSNEEFKINTEMSNTIGELSAEETDVSITDNAVITLTDSDLNTDIDTIQTYDASGGVFEINGEDVGTLTVKAGGEDDILGLGGVDATFIETGPNTGVFVADDIDIGDIDANADGVAGGAGGNLEDGEEITFTYDDLFDDTDDEDSEVTLTLGIPDAGIDVDRSTVPVPQDGDAVTIVLSVIDVNANTNPGSTETVVVPEADMEVRDGDGDEFAGGSADFAELTGITTDITLTETGPNTGIFEEDVELEPDAGVDIDRLIDTRVTFDYDGETVSVTYRAFDGTIVVSPAVVSTGQEFDVTVTDSDINKDPDEEETVDVDCETDEDTEDAGECPITLTETGPNTGIFTETVEAGVDIDVADGDDFSKEILFTYVDEVTSAGDENEEREATVRVATSTGQLSVAPDEVGPGTEITLTLVDTDLNDNPNGVDDVDDADEIVEISSSDGDDGFIGFEETGPNTGIFEATIQFEPRDPDVDGALDGAANEWTYTALPGDVIAFRYEDESTTGGGSTVVSLTFKITSEDPTMEAASPTVQIGAAIALTVEDSDANRDADALDSIDIDITSDSDPVGFTLAALETGEDTGIFTVSIPTSESVTSGAITVEAGDDVFLEYSDEFPADYADRVENVLDPSKDFVLVVPVGTQVGGDTTATTPEPVIPKDISGEELEEVTAGQQVVLSTVVNNNRNTDLDYAAIIEVRDADGFTVLLQWATGTLGPSGENEVGLSWTPMEPGTYTVRTFVLSSVDSPAPLSLIEESTLTVS